MFVASSIMGPGNEKRKAIRVSKSRTILSLVNTDNNHAKDKTTVTLPKLRSEHLFIRLMWRVACLADLSTHTMGNSN